MTKTNKAIMAQINESTADLGWTETQLEFISELLEQAGKKGPKTPEHPPVLDDEGNIIEKWCKRHEQYEPIEDFKESTKNSDGYETNCKVAHIQWVALSKELRKLEEGLIPIINEGDITAVQQHQMKIEAKKTERAGTFKYPTDIKAEVDTKAKEEIVAEPKKRTRRKAAK